MTEEDEIACLPGFAWSVPEAFAPAVAAYRFEQGDVLYRDRRGHGALGAPLPQGLTAIQLLHPPRSARSIPSEYDGDRKLANWQSEVELELVDLERGRSAIQRTTQARLFMTLWKGDERGLRGEGADPPLPRPARELAQVLRDGGLEIAPPRGLREGIRFLFVVDRASDSARAKAAAVAAALHALGPTEVRDHDPREAGAGSDDGGPFHPTLVVRELIVCGVSEPAVDEALRRALSGGSGDVERVSIGRHGVLERLGSAT